MTRAEAATATARRLVDRRTIVATMVDVIKDMIVIATADADKNVNVTILAVKSTTAHKRKGATALACCCQQRSPL